MAEDPHAIIERWLAEAREAEANDPEAMTLATASADGRPAARIVLCKQHDARGFVWFTNGESRKAGELADNPHAALLFHWKSLRRQIRAEGPVEPLPDDDADTYFATRGRDSQLGAWASDQSRPLKNRATFERRFENARKRFEGEDVPRPPHWRGYRLVPERIELWEDRPHRLHHRRLFTRSDGEWAESLLYP